MNTQSTTLFANLTQTETKKLTAVTTETLVAEQPKVFTANDMWNIRRNKKRFSFRRQYA